ncbi:MAG: glutamate 5-kinase [Verrucomicrobiota bacterium]|jgi:glutamate 5-kinase|nr:glutamate 5-kinase [Verrucomicrobiota bacterium]MDK2964296.1 glutamate 5-kinase [Verrucomicrobiota bacterium]
MFFPAQHGNNTPFMKETRNRLKKARRIVVKVGSRVLVDDTGKPDPERLYALVSGISSGHEEGREMILVSSGAIAAGVEALGMNSRPAALPDLQMAAAVGQTRLMNLYSHLFGQRNILVGQVLLTDAIFRVNSGSTNARNTLQNLITHHIIPVINENDAVSTEEITFGDNDILASLVATLIQADALILLTATDGLHNESGQRIPFVERVSDDILALDHGRNGALSTGGMKSKLMAAAKAAEKNIPVVIADGRTDGIIQAVLSGADVGTLIVSR